MLDDIRASLLDLALDTKVLVGVLAAIAAGLLWLATTYDFSNATTHPRIIAALITVAGTLAGIMIGAVLGVLRDWQRDKRERTRVASALLHEIYGHADVVASCGSLVHSKEKNNQLLLQGEMIRFEPPEAIVYRSLASQIVLFPHNDAGAVVAFYGAVNTAKHVTQALPSHEPTTAMANQALQARSRSAQAWRGAAANAIKAIKSLRKYSSASQSGEGKETLENLMEELADIALNKGTPRFRE